MKTLRLRPCIMEPSNVETASSTEAASANSKNAYLVPGVWSERRRWGEMRAWWQMCLWPLPLCFDPFFFFFFWGSHPIFFVLPKYNHPPFGSASHLIHQNRHSYNGATGGEVLLQLLGFHCKVHLRRRNGSSAQSSGGVSIFDNKTPSLCISLSLSLSPFLSFPIFLSPRCSHVANMNRPGIHICGIWRSSAGGSWFIMQRRGIEKDLDYRTDCPVFFSYECLQYTHTDRHIYICKQANTHLECPQALFAFLGEPSASLPLPPPRLSLIAKVPAPVINSMSKERLGLGLIC